MPLPVSRRSAVRQMILAAAALPLAGRSGEAADRPVPAQSPGLKLGVATVSLRALPLENMLAAVRRVGLESISLHRAHSPWENTPEAWRATTEKIRAAGVTPHCCGVLYLKNDEPAMRRMMEYVKILGVSLFSCSPEPAALPLLEKLVREYDLRCALHNHGPEDKVWPTAAGIMAAIAPLDSRIGLCLDVGHSYRAGEDPLEAVTRYHARLYDVHLKDTMAEVGGLDMPVEIGRGKINLGGLLARLRDLGYSGHAWLEYEKDPNDPVPGLAESAGYIRGLLNGVSPV